MTLAARLKDCRDRLVGSEPTYDRLVGHLRSQGVASSAPVVGDRLADFALADLGGGRRTLNDLLAAGPIVLCFIRGAWCPYCREEIRAWQECRTALAAAGGRLVFVTADISGGLSGEGADEDKGAEMLHDVDHGLALTLGLAFWSGVDLQRDLLVGGLDLSESYGHASGILSVPATFVVDREAGVRFAFADPDFRIRAEPKGAIDALRYLS